ncbi:VOC family protein [Miltoncostaea marina]|uniref:VOC family protein n=1 Tax=Miltoncostaea marina TaxID=2843215 RepID=UPI001C3C742B|nr:VOC family protein [Miltoncostaea marina]
MSQPAGDRYIPGVPCWVDGMHPDPRAAAAFYGGLFGWELEESMPPGAPGSYQTATIGGRPVAAIGSVPEGAPPRATWNTYVWVEDAGATAERARAAGGTVVAGPFDVFDAGRTATIADPGGALISLWQPGRHRGAEVVNEHGAVNFNDLHTRDVEQARAFYGAVFGWEVLDLGDGLLWTLPGYGAFLDTLRPGTVEGMRQMGAPEGFWDVVASLRRIGDDEAGVEPHWGVTFGVDDADAVAARAAELGGRVIIDPHDAPWVRSAVIADPQGARFTANQFVPENAPAA